MPLYSKDRSFSLGWTIGGCFIMFLTNIIGGFVLGLAGFHSILAAALLAVVCFALGGFVIGVKSAGQTILEAGLAAVVAALIATLVQFKLRHVRPEPVGLAIGLAVPFFAGLLGGWIGEKVQGDTEEQTY